jgi:hypothetical protein
MFNWEFLPISLLWSFIYTINIVKKLEMGITDVAKTKMKGNNKVINALGYAFNRGGKTIENWIEDKHIILTTPLAVEIIKRETGLTEDQILTPTEVKLPA